MKMLLGDLVEVISGFAFKSEMFSSDSGVPLIRIRDVLRGYTETFYTGDFDPKYLVTKGDILVGMDGEFNSAEWTGINSLLNQRVCKIVPDETRLDRRYLLHFLPRQLKAIEDVTSFVTVKHLSVKDIRGIEVSLPPLEEQKRIAAILDKADSLRRKRAQAIALADDFLRATFLDLFGDKPKNNTLGDMCDIITGFAFQSQNYSLSQDDARLVRGVNVGIGAVDWSDAAYYPISMVDDLNRFILAENDVVLAMDRPWISSGLKCARVTKSEAGAYLVQRVARLRSDVACSEFILQNLMDPTFKQHCRITETTIPHISPKDLQTFPIPSVSKTELAKFELIAQRLRFQAAVAKDSKLVMTDLQRSLDRLI